MPHRTTPSLGSGITAGGAYEWRPLLDVILPSQWPAQAVCPHSLSGSVVFTRRGRITRQDRQLDHSGHPSRSLGVKGPPPALQPSERRVITGVHGLNSHRMAYPVTARTKPPRHQQLHTYTPQGKTSSTFTRTTELVQTLPNKTNQPTQNHYQLNCLWACSHPTTSNHR